MTPTDVDKVVDSLLTRICPVHSIAMHEIKPFTTPDLQYIRHRFHCPTTNCRCEADFVGNELKSDSIGRTLLFLKYLESEGELSLPPS